MVQSQYTTSRTNAPWQSMKNKRKCSQQPTIIKQKQRNDGRYSLPCASLHYASRLNLGVRPCTLAKLGESTLLVALNRLVRCYRSAASSGAGAAMLVLSLILGACAWMARGSLLHGLASATI